MAVWLQLVCTAVPGRWCRRVLDLQDLAVIYDVMQCYNAEAGWCFENRGIDERGMMHLFFFIHGNAKKKVCFIQSAADDETVCQQWGWAELQEGLDVIRGSNNISATFLYPSTKSFPYENLRIPRCYIHTRYILGVQYMGHVSLTASGESTTKWQMTLSTLYSKRCCATAAPALLLVLAVAMATSWLCLQFLQMCRF